MKLTTTFLCLALMAVPALAQNSLQGPVHFPAGQASTQQAQGVSSVPAPAPLLQAPPVSQPGAVAQDIRDIRGPISIPYAWLWAIYFAGGILAMAAIYGLWRVLRRRAKVKAKLPYEIALERLEEARALMTTGTVREYAFTVSEIVRVYIEQRFNEKAARRTTEEFLSDLLQQTGTPLAKHRDNLKDFLNHCDLIKFARWQLSVPEMEAMHESARFFILNTRPLPEPAKAKTPPPPSVVLPPVPQPEPARMS